MIRRRLWISLIGIVAVAVVWAVGSVAFDARPVLGLDLRGGASVVLTPTGDATIEDLTVIRNVIADDLERRGITDAEVRIDGLNVVVDLPGVNDQREAVEVVQTGGIVTIRPLMQECTLPVASTSSEPSSGSTEPTGTATDTTATESTATESTVAETSVPESTATASSAPQSSVSESTQEPSGFARPAAGDTTTPESSAPESSAPESSAPESSTPPSSEPSTSVEGTAAESSVPESSEPASTTSTEPPPQPLGTNPIVNYPETPFGPPPAPPEDSVVTLTTRDGFECSVGPVTRAGTSPGNQFFEPGSTTVGRFQDVWVVNATPAEHGRGVMTQLSLTCAQQGQTACPTGQMAIVVDDTIARLVQVPQGAIPETMDVGIFSTESEARALAGKLDRGSFPVAVEASDVQLVSPTLGDDAADAALIAVLIGGLVLAAALLFFYRRLGAVGVGGFVVWGLLVYAAAGFIAAVTNVALSLAGLAAVLVTGGIAIDNTIVYFERLKEEVRHGRTLRNSALRGFKSAWRTILAADFVALLVGIVLIAAGSGAVRTFGVYLSVGSLAAILVAWLYTRSAVALLANSGSLDQGDVFGVKRYTTTLATSRGGTK